MKGVKFGVLQSEYKNKTSTVPKSIPNTYANSRQDIYDKIRNYKTCETKKKEKRRIYKEKHFMHILMRYIKLIKFNHLRIKETQIKNIHMIVYNLHYPPTSSYTEITKFSQKVQGKCCFRSKKKNKRTEVSILSYVFSTHKHQTISL